MTKRSLVRLGLALLLTTGIVSPAVAHGWQANEYVEVLWQGKWYKATIRQVKGTKYLVHYDDYDADTDEWVTATAVRNWYGVGSQVEAFWNNQKWYPATVVKVDGERYFIHYDHFGSGYTHWVTRKILRLRGDLAPN